MLIKELPNEILFKILSYCKPIDLLSIGLTSSRFKCYIDCDNLWEKLLKRDFPYDCYKRDGKYYCPIIECVFEGKDFYIEYILSAESKSIYLKYKSLSENSKSYYEFLSSFSTHMKLLYHRSINRVLECISYVGNINIIDYNKIIKEYEMEIYIEILFFNNIIKWLITDIKWESIYMIHIKENVRHLYEKIKLYSKYNNILNTLCKKFIHMLKDNDTMKYESIIDIHINEYISFVLTKGYMIKCIT